MWELAKKHPLLAGISALACILVLAAAVDGIGARRAAARYFDRAWGWAKAYDRDTAASKKEYENKIRALTLDRDSYRKKYEAAMGRLNAPWSPPTSTKALQDRFTKLGYRGRLK